MNIQSHPGAMKMIMIQMKIFKINYNYNYNIKYNYNYYTTHLYTIDSPFLLFPLILKVASKKMSELKVYGNDWDTKDGTCVRDYIHVMDLADGHIEALKYLQNNGVNKKI